MATEVLRNGIHSGGLRLAHQTVVEFVAAVTRPLADGGPLLDLPGATHEAEEMLVQFEVLYPTEEIIRLGLRGAATPDAIAADRGRPQLTEGGRSGSRSHHRLYPAWSSASFTSSSARSLHSRRTLRTDHSPNSRSAFIVSR